MPKKGEKVYNITIRSSEQKERPPDKRASVGPEKRNFRVLREEKAVRTAHIPGEKVCGAANLEHVKI